MTIINTETMEENPNMIYGDTNREIEDKGDMIVHYITTQANVIKALKLQIKEQNLEIKSLEQERHSWLEQSWDIAKIMNKPKWGAVCGDTLISVKELQEEIKELDHDNKRLKHENEELKEELYESEDSDVDIDGSFKADCYICKRNYIALGLLGGKCVCHDCYPAWYAGIKVIEEQNDLKDEIDGSG